MRYRIVVVVQDTDSNPGGGWHIQNMICLAEADTLQEASQILARVWATADTHPREPEVPMESAGG